MTAKIDKLGPNQVRLEIQVPAARFHEGIERAYRKSRGEFTVPGFRKGKVPRAVIESHYGPGVFYNKAFDELFPDVYSEAVAEANVAPVGPPENLQFLEVERNTGIRFTVDVYVVPEVLLGEYEGVRATRRHRTVTDEEVQKQLETLQRENSRWPEVDGPAEMGDQITVSYELPGREDEAAAPAEQVELGSGYQLESIDSQLVGMSAGDTREITVGGPIEGETSTVLAHVTAVRHRELPPLDDDFAEDVSAFDTIGELREETKKQLQEKVDRELENELEMQILLQILDDSTIDLPAVMVDSEVSDRVARLRQQLLLAGVSLEDYLAQLGIDLQTYASHIRPDAERSLKLHLLMQELIATLGTEPSAEELEEEYSRMAAERGVDADVFRKQMGEQQKGAIAARLANNRMLEKLKEMSEITDEDITESVSGQEETAQEPAEQDAAGGEPPKQEEAQEGQNT